jgi:RND family efflux transporter MFP subunit
MKRSQIFLSLFISLALIGCDADIKNQPNESRAPVVKTLPIEAAQSRTSRLSGTVEAVQQSPLSFQVAGRISARMVNAGDTVRAQELLFELDKRDFEQAKRAADAEVIAASQALQTAQDELERAQRLYKSNFFSEQARDQAALKTIELQRRLDAATSAAEQAQNALTYTSLRAPAQGIVTEVMAEAGQVVSAGQPIGDFAYDGGREIEVYFPQNIAPPAQALAIIGDRTFTAQRAEVSGAAEKSSRTFRARYRLPESANQLAIGTIGELLLPVAAQGLARVPLGAVDERGNGPRVWTVVDQKTEPIPIEVITITRDGALIKTQLPVGTPVVAIGTHLLEPNMVVRVQAK